MGNKVSDENDSYDQSNWHPLSSSEHLSKVTAEVNVAVAIEKIVKSDLKEGTSDGLKNFVDWFNDSLSKGEPILDAAYIKKNASGDLEHTITHVVGFAYVKRETDSLGKKDKVTETPVSAATNLEHNLRNLFDFAREFAPQGVTEEMLKSKFSTNIDNAVEDFTKPNIKRLS